MDKKMIEKSLYLGTDDLARKELRPRSSTVFAVPSRSAVYEETEEVMKSK